MSSNDKWIVRLEHIIEAIEFLDSEVASMSKQQFLSSKRDIMVFERSFEIIGEACKYIPQEIKEKYNDVPWSDIISMRHRISHGYDRVDVDILWDAAESDTILLKRILKTLLDEYGVNND